MASGQIYVGDVGTAFRLEVRDEENAVVNLAPATALRMLFRLPSGSTLDKDAELVNAGTDGLMQYVTEAGDLSEAGGWRYQGHVAFPGASGSFYTDVHKVRVHANLEA